MGHVRNHLSLYLPAYTKPSKPYNMRVAFAYYLRLACYFLPVFLPPQKTAVFPETVFVVKAGVKRDKLLTSVILVGKNRRNC